VLQKSLHATERPDVAAARILWRERQPLLDPERLIFIDETWVTTNMARRCGWAPRGKRLIAGVPYGHWRTPRSSPACAAMASSRHA
jgi:hypothetical protein